MERVQEEEGLRRLAGVAGKTQTLIRARPHCYCLFLKRQFRAGKCASKRLRRPNNSALEFPSVGCGGSTRIN